MRKSFLTFLATILFCAPSLAADYTIEPNPSGTIISSSIPLSTASASRIGVITQQIYLASELTAEGASAGDITAISFYYGLKSGKTEAQAMTRSVQVWILEVPSSGVNMVDSFLVEKVSTQYLTKYKCNGSGKAGTKVFDGTFSTTAITSADGHKKGTITFDNAFTWDGTSNLVVTVADMSNTTVGSDAYANLGFAISPTAHARFMDQVWNSGTADNRATLLNNLTNQYGRQYGSGATSTATQAVKLRYIPKATFSITTTIPAPTNLAASSITTSSATLSWDAVDGASSYNVRWGKTSGNLDNSDNVATNSIDISGLEDGETYYFDVQTVKAAGSSAYASEANFTTTAVTHIHDGITFSKWSSTSSLPAAAGNYYLSNDVTLGADYTVPGNINLCLNGHDIYTDAYYITVPDNKTLALYDNVGGGRIYGYYAVELEYSNNGLITIAADGTLILNGVSVENLANDFNSGEAAYGIYSRGTLKISGAPVISGYDADINLYTGRVITIESGKPLTNTTPYRIYTSSIGDITSGWANMNGANPSDYLTSAPPARGVCLNSATGEARFVRNLRINESNDNDNISDPAYASQLINVSMTRSLTSSQYNTFCLPFALSDAQLQLYFGAGYDLEEFVSSELDGDLLSLTFNKVTALTAGKPYLLQPAVDVANPTFEAVTLGATSPVDQTSDTYISFIGTFAPTELAGGNKNILFLGADNELFWPASTGNLKGFRAYFEVKGAAQKAAKRARIVQQPGTATGIENQMVNGKCENGKFIKDGQLLIIRDGKTYNILGIECK